MEAMRSTVLSGRPRGRSRPSIHPTLVGFTMVCEETCLNEAGAAAGYYLDVNSVLHAFVREPNGRITEISAPEAGTSAGQGTEEASISPIGVITGPFFDLNNLIHGYVRTPDGKFTTFDIPGATDTLPFSLDLFETTTGIWVDPNFAFHGFSRSAFGNVALFDAPDAGPGAFQGTRPSTNNLEGEVAGWVITASDGNRGFVWQP